jgi:hypothetical protein
MLIIDPIIADGTRFYKSEITNALESGLQKQGIVLGVTQRQDGGNLRGNFCKPPKG